VTKQKNNYCLTNLNFVNDIEEYNIISSYLTINATEYLFTRSDFHTTNNNSNNFTLDLKARTINSSYTVDSIKFSSLEFVNRVEFYDTAQDPDYQLVLTLSIPNLM
jgi:hypothetical protein